MKKNMLKIIIRKLNKRRDFMSEELKKDIVDGKIIDWSKLSVKELQEMKLKFKEKETNLLNQINKELADDESR